jgi:hypothetical protein
MIISPGVSSFSTSSGAQFLSSATTCSRSARPTLGDVASRWACSIGFGGVMLGAPVELCPPRQVQPIVSAPHIELCRDEYRASGWRRDVQDESLGRAFNRPSITTTARAMAPMLVSTA